ncbi:MAG: hypothetical protein V4438_01085 [Patescibacteria group bacterium]
MNKNTLGIGILRYGFVFVFLWFASEQILHPEMWVRLIPAWTVSLSGLSASTVLILNALFEIAGALLLATNLFVPIAAVLLSLHLFGIAIDLGWGAIAVRDIGLAVSLLALAVLSRKE